MRRLVTLFLLSLCAVGCAPLEDASQVRDLRLLHVRGVVDDIVPGPHDEGLRIGIMWLAGDSARWVGASAPAVADGDRYVFDLEIRASTRAPRAIQYQPGWWVGYFVFFQDLDGDGTAKLVGTSFGNDGVLGAAPTQLVYGYEPEGMPPTNPAGGFWPSTFLVDDSAAQRGYHLATGLCPDDGALLRADVAPDDTLVHVVHTGAQSATQWYPHGRIPGGCLGL